MKTYIEPSKDSWIQILQRPTQTKANLEKVVAEVFGKIQVDGDKALLEFTAKFDGCNLNNLKVSAAEIEEAVKNLDPKLKAAIEKAAANIQKFHKNQLIVEAPVEISKGIQCWRKTTAIEKVGLYIPGGTAPLFSTVLMLSIPANIAGCKQITLCSPPNKEGKIHPAILFAAQLCGVTNIFKLGGIQAIGAMTYGTESVNKVYKIFGPGNQYVTSAKQYASLEGVAIDMPAGPSEVLIFADATGDASFIASDLLSQAEHGADSQVVFVTTDEKMITEVKAEVDRQLNALPRKETAAKALANSILISVKNKEEAIQLINEYAPEHLILQSKDEDFFIERIINAGSVFIGNFTPESAGDYASGTNHTLPTNGYARAYSGVSVDSFVKKITFQRISEEGLKELGPTIEIMAEAEELMAHKNAVSIRLKKK
ncbi:MAG: histidinol dehydrogenase [Bacteroidetes bacterium]|nr:histidinol dehydrogenase [Bacteroidota bacterium]